MFVELPKIKDIVDKRKCLDYLNATFATAKYKKRPVHINCPAYLDLANLHKTLPEDIWGFDFYKSDFEKEKKYLQNKNIMIFIGSHKKFTKEESKKLEEFAISWDAPVVCDHTANYHGKNKVLTSQLANLALDCPKPDLVIDIGNVCGEYASAQIYGNAKIWRISEQDNFAFRFSKPVEKYFNCSEKYFFETMTNASKVSSAYYSIVSTKVNEIEFPEIEFSTLYVAKYLCKHMPPQSSLHLAILNSLRTANFFFIDESIDINCNVGGFGIDGAISTAVGQSLVNKNKPIFCLTGDLAFFYDMNVLGNKYIGSNLRIIVINNQRGEEFRLNPVLEKTLGEKTDKLIAAAGHYKNGVKGWAESCNFTYMSADSKTTFEQQIKEFCHNKYNKSVIFEIFTDNINEQNAMNLFRKNSKPIKVKKNIVYKIKRWLNNEK